MRTFGAAVLSACVASLVRHVQAQSGASNSVEQIVETWFEVEPLKHGGYNVTWVWEYNTDITGFNVRFAQDPTLNLPAQVIDVQYGSPEAEAKLNPDGMTPASSYVMFEDNDSQVSEYHGQVISNEDENAQELQIVKSPFFLLIDCDDGFVDPGLLVCSSLEGPIKVFTFVLAPTVTGTLFAWGPGEGEGGVSQPILKYQVATTNEDVIPTDTMLPMVKSDPHFSGLDGAQFDFMGKAGQQYCILQSNADDITLIANFSTAYTSGISIGTNAELKPYQPKGTWINALKLVLTPSDNLDTIMVSTKPSTSRTAWHWGQILVNDKEIESLPVISSGYQIHAVKVTKSNSAISILTDPMDLLVHIVSPPSSWNVKKENLPELSHLNMVVSRIQTEDPSQLMGLLGMTATGQRPQGDDSQYEAQNFVPTEFLM